MSRTRPDPAGGELFFGVVAPIGIDLSILIQELKTALDKVSYTHDEIRVIELLHEIEKWEGLRGLVGQDRYEKHIAAGREFCETVGRNDALVALALGRVKELRSQGKGESVPSTRPRHAYIFRSLKRPDEVRSLRAIYGDAFWLIAASSPRELRVQTLARYLADGEQDFDSRRFRAEAERLVGIDENEAQYSRSQNYLPDHGKGLKQGQDVRATFPMADVFVDTSDHRDLKYSIRRFIRNLFQYQFNTPTRDEYGMAHARVASLRSSDLSRQVGATIARPDGTIVASGTNEVPCSGGGLYWTGDAGDRRDFQLRKNVSYRLRRSVLMDVIRRLSGMEKLSEDWKANVDQDVVKAVEEALESGLLRDARVMDAIEFGRTVHAEMAAIMDAARNGLAIQGCTLYTTTFPCHDCARHIVASGIKRVVYIEPYPKSLASELLSDSIEVDPLGDSSTRRVRFESFVGVSPDRYNVLFQMGRRRGEGDQIATWQKKTAVPRLSGIPASYLVAEIQQIERLAEDLQKHGLVPVEPPNGTLEQGGT